MTDIKMFTATKAFVIYDGKVLILRESDKYQDGTNASRYDVPGGRVQPGQRFDESLLREIKEETGLTMQIGRPFCVNEWRPVVRGESWQIIGTFFICHANSNVVTLSEDHDVYEWIDPKDYALFNLIPSNIKAFEAYLELGL